MIGVRSLYCMCFFFFNDTATTEIYTLSLHDALPSCTGGCPRISPQRLWTSGCRRSCTTSIACEAGCRSEEHTSELQSRRDLVCRLLLEKKKKYLTSCSIKNKLLHHIVGL